MIVVTDSNIIFSALYTPNGVIASILKNKNKIQLLAPNFLILEIKNHFNKILVHRKITKKELQDEFNDLIKNIDIINIEEIPKNIVLQAIEIVKEIDIDDTIFVALHLYTKHKIWTTDNILNTYLKEKGHDICITTTELKKYLYKK
jgi:predicted nucleic acid-binding protein